MAFFSRNILSTSTQQNVDPNPSKEVQDLRTEINQCNIEWRQAFREQQMQIDKLKEKIQVQDKIMSRDIQYIIGLLLNQMVTIIEDEVLGEKRQIKVDDRYEQGQKKARLN